MLTQTAESLLLRPSTARASSRPLSAVFSFRDNALTSHREAKSLIEHQTGVKVKSLQFDPAGVRSHREQKSRWIVDLYSDWDLHAVIDKGLISGKDRLFFYKYDICSIESGKDGIKYFEKLPESKPKIHRTRHASSSMHRDGLLMKRDSQEKMKF
ncbi:hypothetical protein ACF0H5_018666 [Mactra antiquata]